MLDRVGVGFLASDRGEVAALFLLLQDDGEPEHVPVEGERAIQARDRQSDVVDLHTPLSEQTRTMINADTVAMIKPGAYVINTSRGGIVDESALAAASRPEYKKMVLGAMANIANLGVLDLALKCLDKPELKAEAELAAVRIARAVSGSYQVFAVGCLSAQGPLVRDFMVWTAIPLSLHMFVSDSNSLR